MHYVVFSLPRPFISHGHAISSHVYDKEHRFFTSKSAVFQNFIILGDENKQTNMEMLLTNSGRLSRFFFRCFDGINNHGTIWSQPAFHSPEQTPLPPQKWNVKRQNCKFFAKSISSQIIEYQPYDANNANIQHLLMMNYLSHFFATHNYLKMLFCWLKNIFINIKEYDICMKGWR